MDRTWTIIPVMLLLAGATGVGLTLDVQEEEVPRTVQAASEGKTQDATRLRFGMDAASIQAQTTAGVKPDIGTVWVGPWILEDGWGEVDAALRSMRAAGVTPGVHLYYWGGDISRSCLQEGCWSDVHQAHKDQEGWDRLTEQLLTHLQREMGGKRVLVFLETEFNNGDVQTYETLDAALAAKAQQIRGAYPAAQVVLPLGNWNREHWGTWDRAAAASDLIGIQGLRGSTRDSWSAYTSLYDATLAGTKKAQALFGKPLVVHDIGLSTYPEPDYLQVQADTLQRLFDGMPALQAAGVEAFLYREWADDPQANLAEYYGPGERHWGLITADGTAKPAAGVWVEGVQGLRR